MPNETQITGKWVESGKQIVEDETCSRIANLIRNHLVETGHDPSGWATLYRDPIDGRLWELTYPQGELQGGGPPQLRYISTDQATHTYEMP